MIANFAPQLDRPAPRHHPSFDKGQPVRRVIEQGMPPRLRLQRDAKGGIGMDVHRSDRVHLKGDLKRHLSLRAVCHPLMTQQRTGCKPVPVPVPVPVAHAPRMLVRTPQSPRCGYPITSACRNRRSSPCLTPAADRIRQHRHSSRSQYAPSHRPRPHQCAHRSMRPLVHSPEILTLHPRCVASAGAKDARPPHHVSGFS